MVMLGREVHQPVDLVIGVPDVDPPPPDHDDYVADLHARMKSVFEMVRATLKKYYASATLAALSAKLVALQRILFVTG